MKGKLIYFAVAALIGLLAALVQFIPFILLFLLYVFILFKFKSFSKIQLLLLISVFILYIFAGAIAVSQNKTVLTGNETKLTVFLEQWEADGDQLRISVQDTMTNEKLLLKYRMKTYEERKFLESNLKYGLICPISGKLKTPSQARNPNAFDYQQYLSSKQIFWIMTANRIPIGSCVQARPSFQSFTEKIRHDGMQYVVTHFPEPIASLSAALLFGVRNLMATDLVSSYQQIGIVHLIAISGLQVTFLTGVIYWIGIRLGMVREKMIIVMILFLPFYALLTGASPSVVRAVLMMILILISLKIGHRRFLPIDALSGALLFMLIVSPFLLFDVGFQLSFSACFSLILSLRIFSNGQNHGLQLLLTTVIAQAATLPIILYNFYEISSISIVANFLFVPFFSVFLTPFVFFIFIFHPFIGYLLTPFLILANQLIILANRVIEGLSKFPFHMITPGRPGVILVILYIAFILIAFVSWENRPGRMIKGAFPLVFLIVFQIGQNLWSPAGEVTFIDVGQGDAILIKLPFNRGTYLIDTGGTIGFAKEKWQEKSAAFEVGKDIVIPFLKSKGITTIDKLILTHGDQDHLGGAAAIIRELKVKEIIFPKKASASNLAGSIKNLAEENQIKTSSLSQGDSWRSGNNTFHVLSPPEDFNSDENNSSIVIYAEIGGLTWLFTGDMEEEMEKRLAVNYPPIDIDVLKAGHHGSRSSTSQGLLAQFTPEIVMISSGENNRYGHPHQEVLSRLEELNIQILRTDQHGAISYFFKNGNGTFSVWIP